MKLERMQRVQVIDSHTGGEPTRVVIAGAPDLGGGSMAERLARFRAEYDGFRSAVVNEPRGSDPVVGALLCEPVDAASAAGVVFFNNVGYLGMCGHGTIGIVVTLAHLGRVGVGAHRIETPVGTVTAHLDSSGAVAVENVPSYRYAKDVTVEAEGYGPVTGDVAWGGNWFFIVGDSPEPVRISNLDRLAECTKRIRRALERFGITGTNGAEIDHVELVGPAEAEGADAKNYVLCPGAAYDRSPCGTGTSAKIACLAADGELKESELWRQESITGSLFEGTWRRHGDAVIPTIRGSAWVCAEATLILDPSDPFALGIRT
jgi:4-hydroxyproline epimerase